MWSASSSSISCEASIRRSAHQGRVVRVVFDLGRARTAGGASNSSSNASAAMIASASRNALARAIPNLHSKRLCAACHNTVVSRGLLLPFLVSFANRLRLSSGSTSRTTKPCRSSGLKSCRAPIDRAPGIPRAVPWSAHEPDDAQRDRCYAAWRAARRAPASNLTRRVAFRRAVLLHWPLSPSAELILSDRDPRPHLFATLMLLSKPRDQKLAFPHIWLKQPASIQRKAASGRRFLQRHLKMARSRRCRCGHLIGRGEKPNSV
jgi:hypothetical protein